jgi:hypothetical protein
MTKIEDELLYKINIIYGQYGNKISVYLGNTGFNFYVNEKVSNLIGWWENRPTPIIVDLDRILYSSMLTKFIIKNAMCENTKYDRWRKE